MLEHGNAEPCPPARVVIIGAGGFVGSAVKNELDGRGVETLGLTRAQVDLLADDAVQHLKAPLRPEDSVVFVSAIAPAKTVQQLMDNLRMAEAACAVFEKVQPAHLLYISSDAIYATAQSRLAAIAPTPRAGALVYTLEEYLDLKMPPRAVLLAPVLREKD